MKAIPDFRGTRPGRPESASGGPLASFGAVAACLDGSELAERVIPHALAIAKALGAPIVLLRAIEAPPAQDVPPDPLEWDIRRREARAYLERLVEGRAGEGAVVEAEVVEGQAAEQVCAWARHHDVEVTALCSHGAGGHSQWSLAGTARKLIERVPGSLLLVPAAAAPAGRVARYRRILVPLDGSPYAESVLPVATRLAIAEDAELILAHVVPVPELTQIGPLDAEDLELRERLRRRNERAAGTYLDRLRARLAAGGLSPRAVVLHGGDVRRRLVRLIEDETVDLVVLSAHGRSGRSERACGSVAAYVIEQASAPLLVMRQRSTHRRRGAPSPAEHGDVRLPSQAVP